MSENRMTLLAADAAGQPLRVGDLAGGVRLKPQPHTIVGKVMSLGKERVKLLVTWSSNGTSLNQEESVYLNRTFKLSSDGQAGADAAAMREIRRLQLNRALNGTDNNESWLELITRVVRLREMKKLDDAIIADDQLTDVDDGSILSRANLENRYRAMISSVARRTWTTVPDELVERFLTETMQIRDNEVRLLRMRLRLATELHQASGGGAFGTAVDMINPDELNDAADYLENHDPSSEKVQRDLRRWADEIRRHNADELSRLGREIQGDTLADDVKVTDEKPVEAPDVDAAVEELVTGVKTAWGQLKGWLNGGDHR